MNQNWINTILSICIAVIINIVVCILVITILLLYIENNNDHLIYGDRNWYIYSHKLDNSLRDE